MWRTKYGRQGVEFRKRHFTVAPLDPAELHATYLIWIQEHGQHTDMPPLSHLQPRACTAVPRRLHLIRTRHKTRRLCRTCSRERVAQRPSACAANCGLPKTKAPAEGGGAGGGCGCGRCGCASCAVAIAVAGRNQVGRWAALATAATSSRLVVIVMEVVIWLVV